MVTTTNNLTQNRKSVSGLFDIEIRPRLYVKPVDGMLQRALKTSDGFYEAYTAVHFRDDGSPWGGCNRVLNSSQIDYLKQNFKDVVYKELSNIGMGYWVFRK